MAVVRAFEEKRKRMNSIITRWLKGQRVTQNRWTSDSSWSGQIQTAYSRKMKPTGKLEADLSRKRLERKSQKEVQNRTGVGNVSIVREENGILNIESCSRKLSGWKQWPRTMAGMFHINMLTYELNKESYR